MTGRSPECVQLRYSLPGLHFPEILEKDIPSWALSTSRLLQQMDPKILATNFPIWLKKQVSRSRVLPELEILYTLGKNDRKKHVDREKYNIDKLPLFFRRSSIVLLACLQMFLNFSRINLLATEWTSLIFSISFLMMIHMVAQIFFKFIAFRTKSAFKLLLHIIFENILIF